jgi:hypothetical protein
MNVEYHILEALRGAIAETEGDECLSRRLNAETKLRLIRMSDEEIRELAKVTSIPKEQDVELVYKHFKTSIEELKATASTWIGDLANKEAPECQSILRINQ